MFQTSETTSLGNGDELGSTGAIKGQFLLGMIPPQRVKNINANDNSAFVAANDNTVVEVRVAA